MTCRARDQDLLLLAHGALPAPRRLLTELHLRRCQQCQDRQRQLAAASAALAGAIRDPGQARWRLPHPQPALIHLWSVILVMLVGLVIVFGVIQIREHGAAAGPGLRHAAPAGGCRPDLPNDRCR